MHFWRTISHQSRERYNYRYNYSRDHWRINERVDVKLRELSALLLSQTQRRDVNAVARECE